MEAVLRSEKCLVVKKRPSVLLPADGSSQGYFTSERRCPRCERRMATDGKGNFKCPECRFYDWQDVSKLYAAGLDYPFWAPAERIKYGRCKTW